MKKRDTLWGNEYIMGVRSLNPNGWYLELKATGETVGFVDHVAFIESESNRILRLILDKQFEEVILEEN